MINNSGFQTSPEDKEALGTPIFEDEEGERGGGRLKLKSSVMRMEKFKQTANWMLAVFFKILLHSLKK